MKKHGLALAIALTAFAGLASAGQAPEAKVLTRAEFDGLLAHPAKLLIIDVRRPDEYAGGTFPVFLSVQIDDLEKQLAYIPKDRNVVTVSNHKGRSGRAAAILLAHGYKVLGTIGAQT